MFDKLRPFIFKFSPEVAHSLAIKALKLNAIPKKKIENQSILKSNSTSNLESNSAGNHFAQIVQQRLKELATIHPQEQYLAQLQAYAEMGSQTQKLPVQTIL